MRTNVQVPAGMGMPESPRRMWQGTNRAISAIEITTSRRALLRKGAPAGHELWMAPSAVGELTEVVDDNSRCGRIITFTAKSVDRVQPATRGNASDGMCYRPVFSRASDAMQFGSLLAETIDFSLTCDQTAKSLDTNRILCKTDAHIMLPYHMLSRRPTSH